MRPFLPKGHQQPRTLLTDQKTSEHWTAGSWIPSFQFISGDCTASDIFSQSYSGDPTSEVSPSIAHSVRLCESGGPQAADILLRTFSTRQVSAKCSNDARGSQSLMSRIDYTASSKSRTSWWFQTLIILIEETGIILITFKLLGIFHFDSPILRPPRLQC